MTTTLPAGWKPRLSCPFCGSNCLFTEPDEVGSGGQWVSPIHVGCNDCQAEQVGDTEDEAVSRWNARFTPSASAQPARDWELDCDHCNGSGHVFVKHQVAELKTDVQEFKEECECCEGRGFVFAFQDIPGIEEYVKSCRPAIQHEPITVSLDPDPRGVSVGVWQGSSCIYTGAHAVPASVAPGDAQGERSPTHGMTLGERIAHVGGRTNAQSYIEFGSPMAVNALIQHVLRDLDWTRQDDDGAYQARYRLPGGQWSSWGHVVCGVKSHEQELRYLPGERRPAPAAGDALAATAPEWAACESRRPWVTNSLKASAEKLRNKERRCRATYTQDFYGIPARYVADAYAEAAAVFEAKLAALAAQVQQQGEA